MGSRSLGVTKYIFSVPCLTYFISYGYLFNCSYNVVRKHIINFLPADIIAGTL